MSDYPEHDKLKALNGANQTIGDFLEWLDERGIWLASYHEHTERCVCDHEYHNPPHPESWSSGGCPRCFGWPHKPSRACGYFDEQLAPSHMKRDDWIAAFFNIDPNRLEDEKRAMLGVLRAVHD